jgi:hypothetical protein
LLAEGDRWLDEFQAAELTGLAVNTLRDWRGRSKRHRSPPFHKQGRHALYRLSDVLAWMETHNSRPGRPRSDGGDRGRD